MMLRTARVASYPVNDAGSDCVTRKQCKSALKVFVVVVIILMFLAHVLVKQNERKGLELTILHTNNVHARVHQFDKNMGPCTGEGEGEGEGCFGGVARIYTAIQQVRKEKEHVLLVDTGGRFTGTTWFEHYMGLASATFMNMMKYDVMTLGNREFDLGPRVLRSFIKKLRFPVLTTNIDFSGQPDWPVEEKFHLKSTIVKFENKSVAIIGFTTPETKRLSSPGPKIDFASIMPAIQKEVRKLKNRGINIFIGLGHADFHTDVEVLKNIPELDLVVGGHSGAFPYMGTQPSTDEAEGPYPYVVRNNAKNQLLVRSHSYGRYLGLLNVQFDEDGEVKSWSGNPVLLDSSIKRNKKILEEVNRMSAAMKTQSDQIIGFTAVSLNGETCRTGECSFGNMIADAIAAMTRTDHVIFNGGGIRTSLVKKNAGDGITSGDLNSIHPFENAMDIVTLRGSVLKEAFEHSVSALPKERLGRFLQVSGFRVWYNTSKPVGERVVNIVARVVSSNSSVYKEVKDADLYTVAVPDFLTSGGDGFSVLKDHESRQSGEKIVSLVKRFMGVNSPISPRTDGRITMVGRNGGIAED